MPIEFCFDELTIGDHFNLMVAATMEETGSAAALTLVLPVIARCTDTDIMALPMHMVESVIATFLAELGEYMRDKHGK